LIGLGIGIGADDGADVLDDGIGIAAPRVGGPAGMAIGETGRFFQAKEFIRLSTSPEPSRLLFRKSRPWLSKRIVMDGICRHKLGDPGFRVLRGSKP
jgi:hypothetical protein